jgi:DNA-3-methyladenine glycosylase I
MRCSWASSREMIAYHDKVWGVPVHDDRVLFEMLTLEGAQAGLSWATILKRQETYQKAFDNFNVEKIAEYDEKDVQRLLHDPGIIRNKLKVRSTITNAKAFLKIKKEFGSFDNYIWKFGGPLKNTFKDMTEIPSTTSLSDVISKDLKSRGFSFVGSTIIYAFMQAVGIVNDHEVSCFRYEM